MSGWTPNERTLLQTSVPLILSFGPRAYPLRCRPGCPHTLSWPEARAARLYWLLQGLTQVQATLQRSDLDPDGVLAAWRESIDT